MVGYQLQGRKKDGKTKPDEQEQALGLMLNVEGEEGLFVNAISRMINALGKM
jgi:hypothetical protein